MRVVKKMQRTNSIGFTKTIDTKVQINLYNICVAIYCVMSMQCTRHEPTLPGYNFLVETVNMSYTHRFRSQIRLISES